ncbi:transglutaminase domain-containing protein, partial [Pirellulales bacterium]|nr:transglutaminase domain-containing protein [Pirellulales bacterium]
CIPNPSVPDGPVNYLRVTSENVDFLKLRVQPGDIVRYYVNVNQESAERGFDERTYFSLPVRRLSEVNPQSDLIIDAALAGSVLAPERLEVWRYSDRRMNEIRATLDKYVQFRRPTVGWEPSPDEGALAQVVERANQWLRNQPASDDWVRNPLVETVPEALSDAPSVAEAISDASLRDGRFEPFEGRFLQQAVWCRDIAMWAKGSAVTDREIVANLFDWTVRNIQLEPADAIPYIRQPWQALLYGRGTAEHRAWVFVELCRQEPLPAALLAVKPTVDDPSEFWTAAVYVDNAWRLFDPRLGLPLLGETGDAASLQEIVAQPELLEALAVETPEGERLAYPVDADSLQRIEAWVVASPLQLSRRAELLENGLQSEAFVRLTAETQTTVERLKEVPAIRSVKLWTQPLETIVARRTVGPPVRRQAGRAFAPFAYHPRLWKARAMHFQGRKPPPPGRRGSILAEARDGHLDAIRAYQNKEVRPGKRELAEMESARRSVDAAAKAAAGYWLGLLLFDAGKYETARRWLDDRTLQAAPEGRWADGARYNLARVHEALDDVDRAVELLKSGPDDAPGRHGNLLRARQLEAAAEGTGE